MVILKRIKRISSTTSWSSISISSRDGKKSSKSKTDSASEEETLAQVVKRLLAEADETDNRGDHELAFQQYQAIRDLIAVSTTIDGAVADIDKKAALSMGMIYEFEKEDFQKARFMYQEALQFYRKTLEYLTAQEGSERSHISIRDELTERVCTVLLRLAVTSGQKKEWKQSLQESRKAMDSFSTLSGLGLSSEEKDGLEQQIKDQLLLCEEMLRQESLEKEHQEHDDETEQDGSNLESLQAYFESSISKFQEAYASFIQSIAPAAE